MALLTGIAIVLRLVSFVAVNVVGANVLTGEGLSSKLGFKLPTPVGMMGSLYTANEPDCSHEDSLQPGWRQGSVGNSRDSFRDHSNLEEYREEAG